MKRTINECCEWLEYRKQSEVGEAVEYIDIAVDIMHRFQKLEEALLPYEKFKYGHPIDISTMRRIMYENDD